MTSEDTELEARALKLLEDSLDLPVSERAAWITEQAGDNDALRERALSLLSFDRPGSAIRTGQAAMDSDDESPAPERIGAYLITGVIGQGGMGTVYRGERATGDFDHDVAIKVIKPKVLSEELVARFERERQTLASLSHRHIAKLFDGGTTEDGAPYIIMEYVAGVPITDYCREANLPPARRLRLFLDGCDAVAYAHRNLIIHRDITPSNMLVTADGEVKLIDFGIAKPLPGDGDDNLPGSPIPSLSFTPGFAAPERQEGGIANTLSDIYSLGKLLDAIMPEDQHTADLKAIIAKASAPDPNKRYATVDALAEDVRRMMSGHTVSARPASAGYRFGKFVTRHSISVALGAAAIAGLVGAFALTFSEYLRAEAALASANERFEQSRELARTMVFDIYDDISLVAGTLEVRKKLVDVLKEYVDDLAGDPYAPDDILMDVAVQYNRLSDVYGGIGISNLGEAEISYGLLLDAEETLDALLARDPDNVEAIDELVWTLRLRTNQELVYNLDVDAAREANDKAMALVDRGVGLPGADETSLADRYWNVRTDHLKVLGYANEQEQALAAVREYRAGLADPALEDTLRGYDRKVAYFASQEGETLYEMGRYDEALEPLTTALEVYRGHVEENPENYYFLVQTMRLEGLIAPSARLSGDAPLSIASARRAVELAERIKALDPEDANGDQFLATQLEQLAKSYSANGQAGQAERTIERAIATRSDLTGRFPSVLSHRRDLALTYKEAGIVYGEIGKRAEQCAYLADAETIMTELQTAESLTDFDVEQRLAEIEALYAESCEG